MGKDNKVLGFQQQSAPYVLRGRHQVVVMLRHEHAKPAVRFGEVRIDGQGLSDGLSGQGVALIAG